MVGREKVLEVLERFVFVFCCFFRFVNEEFRKEAKEVKYLGEWWLVEGNLVVFLGIFYFVVIIFYLCSSLLFLE